MPIPFQVADAAWADRLAAFAVVASDRVPSGDEAYEGALFLVNGRGEPVEFTCNRIVSRREVLWTGASRRRHAERALMVSLLQACPRTPLLLLVREGDVGPALFEEDLRLALPVARLRDGDGESSLDWAPAEPAADSLNAALWRHLAQVGLLTEPFTRAEAGLRVAMAERDARP